LRVVAGLGLGLILAVSAGRDAPAAEAFYPASQPIAVVLDQATLLKLPDRTTTLVVGNPLIADVSVQAGGMLVVTGKSYGVTNLVALDRTGTVLLEHSIEVQGPRNVMVVYRGVERESYSCTPKCERRITLGDTQPYFGGMLTQTGTLNTQAQGTGQGPK